MKIRFYELYRCVDQTEINEPEDFKAMLTEAKDPLAFFDILYLEPEDAIYVPDDPFNTNWALLTVQLFSEMVDEIPEFNADTVDDYLTVALDYCMPKVVTNTREYTLKLPQDPHEDDLFDYWNSYMLTILKALEEYQESYE